MNYNGAYKYYKEQYKKYKQPKNIFYYLSRFKNNVIKIVFGQYTDRKYVTDMFFRWYMSNLDPSYIPQHFDIMYDLKYMKMNDAYEKQQQINTELAKTIKMLDSHTVEDVFIDKHIFSDIQLDMLKVKYTGDTLQHHVDFLSEMFYFLEGYHNNYSVDPRVINKFDLFELFGSSVNTQMHYCSPFNIDKQYFGASGDFFNYDMSPGKYLANPPFDYNIIDKMIARLVQQMKKHDGIDVIIIFPVWSDFDSIVTGIKNNENYVDMTVLKRMNVKYYDYFKDKYANVVDCYCVHMSNCSGKLLNGFVDYWSLLSV